jgi:hypothetical protein
MMATSKKASTGKSTAKSGARQDVRAGSKPAQGLQKAVQPSAELAAIVSQEPLPRTEITKKLWEKVFQSCGSGILCWRISATNFVWGYRDDASAALSLLPRE